MKCIIKIIALPLILFSLNACHVEIGEKDSWPDSKLNQYSAKILATSILTYCTALHNEIDSEDTYSVSNGVSVLTTDDGFLIEFSEYSGNNLVNEFDKFYVQKGQFIKSEYFITFDDLDLYVYDPNEDHGNDEDLILVEKVYYLIVGTLHYDEAGNKYSGELKINNYVFDVSITSID
jgi:hypothetical protein